MKTALVLLLFLIFTSSAYAQSKSSETFDLFYLAVGNSHYATHPEATGFKDLPGGNKSAITVAEFLDKAGAIAGITLVSEEKKFVTKNDVLRALNDLLRQIKLSKAQRPLLIFYFCGHGVSEGIGWSHFSIPGDFTIPLKGVNPGTMIESAVYASEISDLIEEQKIPAMLLLDACYEVEQAELPEAVLSHELAQNSTDVFRTMRYKNEFNGPTIAVFSTRPGSLVPMVQDPFDPKSKLKVGPLARRLSICFAAALNRKDDPLPIGELLQTLGNRRFDPKTRSVVTFSVPENGGIGLIKYPLVEANRGESRIGSGKKKRVLK